ncbi:MAG: SDR family oxidoreductase [Candidatus Levyibacteriota bacterium]
MSIFTIGGSGLVGSRIVELLDSKHTFDDLSLSKGVDITNPSSLDIIKNDTEHDVVLLLAAKADVDGCEADKPMGEEGAAFKINVTGVQNVVNACKQTNKKILYISTDFVFDGTKEPPYEYTEDDIPNPGNWYATTKYKGEEVVKNSDIPFLIVRIAYPYRKEFPLKKDFVRAIASRLENNQPVAAVTDHIMTPTLIDDVAFAVDVLLENNEKGIYHVVGSESLSPYDAAMTIADIFGFDKSLISKTTRAEYFKGKAQRPFNLSLNNARIKQLGVTMHGFAEGLQKIVNV